MGLSHQTPLTFLWILVKICEHLLKTQTGFSLSNRRLTSSGLARSANTRTPSLSLTYGSDVEVSTYFWPWGVRWSSSLSFSFFLCCNKWSSETRRERNGRIKVEKQYEHTWAEHWGSLTVRPINSVLWTTTNSTAELWLEERNTTVHWMISLMFSSSSDITTGNCQ